MAWLIRMEKELESYFDRLFPIPRSLTGDGVRDTLKILQGIIDLKIHEVPTGTKALDWTIPNEWNVREAWILTPEGKKIADFSVNNLHLLGYSVPVDGAFSYEELRPHLITRPDMPDAIPYATSYYEERWGFCLSHNEFLTLPREGNYRVKIDSQLSPGSMTYGEAILRGESEKEVLFTSYVCHPSMANNELSGPLAVAFLYRELKKITNRRFTYRFLLGPETLGALFYLSRLGEHWRVNLEAGLVLTCCGDAGPLSYKKSRPGSYIDSLVPHLLRFRHGDPPVIRDFFPMGSDERQYGSPGFNLPVGCLTRSMYGTYPEYHTSLDNKAIINFSSLADTIGFVLEVVQGLEQECLLVNRVPEGEPQLGRRGLYPTLMSDLDRGRSLERLLYVLNFSDGQHRLLDIAERMGASMLEFEPEISRLEEKGLILRSYTRLHEVR